MSYKQCQRISSPSFKNPPQGSDLYFSLLALSLPLKQQDNQQQQVLYLCYVNIHNSYTEISAMTRKREEEKFFSFLYFSPLSHQLDPKKE